jgi:uncharacterized protein GlcG (DUF336 family)
LKFKIFGSKSKPGRIDITFLLLVLAVLTIGLIMLFSASYVEALYREGDSFFYIKKQLMFAAAGIIAMFAIAYLIDYHWLHRFAFAIYIVSIFLLIIVYFCPAVNGVHRWIPVPLVGTVAAGMPILAEENFEGYVGFMGRKSADGLFALRVKGESMIEAGILDGDIVVVEKTCYAENGEIVVAMIDNEATVKTFFRENGHYRLQPENSTMEPIIVNEVDILGKVCAVQRIYA